MSSSKRPRLGPFEIDGLLGTGGFASVYRAHDRRLNSDVAIKILADNHALNPDVRARFIREAQAIRRIDSPNVVSIYDIGETGDGRPYLVLEFADRGGLLARRQQRVAEGWQPNRDDVRFLIKALAEALGPIHAEKLVHRDVTPTNVLIRSGSGPSGHGNELLFDQDERLMLSDLGLVKDLGASSGLTAGSGTAGFASPEQQQELTTLDARSDVYAATAVVLWLIVGQSPQPASDVAAVLDQQGWPRPFAEAMGKGLADQPEERHGTIDDWQTDLLSALPLIESSTPGSDSAGNGQGPGVNWLHRIGYAAAGLVAVAALFVALRPNSLNRPTLTGGDEPATAASTPLNAEVATPPRPDLQHFFFASADDRTILTMIWGAPEVPSNVVGTEIAVAVDDGGWVIEKRVDHHSARDWQLYSTDAGTAERRPVTSDSLYEARVRWILDDGSVSEWSRHLMAG